MGKRHGRGDGRKCYSGSDLQRMHTQQCKDNIEYDAEILNVDTWNLLILLKLLGGRLRVVSPLHFFHGSESVGV